MNFSVDLVGDWKKLEKDAQTMDVRFRQALTSKATDVISITHDASVMDTPLDFGPLREDSEGLVSGHVVSIGSISGAVQNASIRIVGHTFTGRIGYQQDYAPIQHENTDFRHEFGHAKFLEKACMGLEKANIDRYISAFDKL